MDDHRTPRIASAAFLAILIIACNDLTGSVPTAVCLSGLRWVGNT